MIEDVYEPLTRYRDEFRSAFAENAREKFRALVAAAGIDVDANRRTVAAVQRLEKQLASLRSARVWRGVLIFLAACGVLGGGGAAYALYSGGGRIETAAACAFAAAASLVSMFLAISAYRALSRRMVEVTRVLKRHQDEAWRQMAPLNRLYTWDIPVRLIERTVPRLAFDPFFTAVRLDGLARSFGWDGSFNDGRSVVFAQSGVINGNPFVVGDLLEMEWGTHTYEGHLTIHWTEWEGDADGRSHAVSRSETLYATVEKPVPVYSDRKVVVYGNDAAPNLAFSREPSALSQAGDGFFARWRKKRVIRKLQRFSRNLDDDSQYTLMANHEFEALFHATDRNDEVEFRLLFTALAQTQLLLLMKDDKVGYGDDFRFIKTGKVNFIEPGHLADAPIDTDPARFRHWDVDAAARNFLAFNEKYFKDLYFAFAPLLSIPLYQQTRTREDIWKGVATAPSAFWEHESLANWYGEKRFAHPDCITRSILKTQVTGRRDGVSRVAVTAHGFRGEEHVDHVSVHGGDGCWHDVPVEWTKYLPVSRTRDLLLTEGESAENEKFRTEQEMADSAVYRRSIHSRLA